MLRWLLIVLVFLISGPFYIYYTKQVDFSTSWRDAFNGSAHIAPDPTKHPEAIIQVYAARAFNWRGLLADHLWIATKSANAQQYFTYQVIGWYVMRGLPALVIRNDVPDRYWYGNKPHLLMTISDTQAEKLIPKIIRAAHAYPYKNQYTAWPGPNSNTFIAFIARQVPELGLTLPPNALGQDYLGPFTFFANAPSGTGYQFSLFGVLGLTIAKKEGVRINFLGLTTGINFEPFGFIYPAIGIVK